MTDASVRTPNWPTAWLIGLVLTALCAAGCLRAPGNLYYLSDAEVKGYRKRATDIAYPDVNLPTDPRASESAAPRKVSERAHDEIRDIALQDVIKLALENSAILRTRQQFLRQAGNVLLDSGSVFDPAIQQSEVSFNRQGVEAALSEFDVQQTVSMLWGRDERIQNNPFTSGGLAPGATLQEDTAAFKAQLAKQLATGGRISLTDSWNYEYNNSPNRLFPSIYYGSVEAEYRQPFLAGYGVDFTRTSGSVFRRDPFREGTGLDQGVLIARIREDQSIADFQSQVMNLIKDAEDLYWELALQYHIYDTEVTSRNSALRTWREARVKFEGGLPGGNAADEAQAADSYFDARSRTQGALADLYNTEGQLRRLIGLPVNDGTILRPADDPMTAEFLPDWHVSVLEAMTYRPELRRQKWDIKSLSLQLKSAQNLARPRLDFVSRYRVNAFGNQLVAPSDNDGVTRQGLQSAVETLTAGNQTGWNLGFEYDAPFGFRAAHAQVRNIELKLAKSKRLLAEQELEISHELAQSFTDLDRWHTIMQTNFARRQAAKRRVEAYNSDYEAGRLQSVDQLLRAQISLAQAENAYFRSLVEYNRAINAVYYRKGTLLERNNIHLAEGPWSKPAYEQALRREIARAAALPGDWALTTIPPEMVKRRPPRAPSDSNTAENWGSGDEPPTEQAPTPQPLPPQDGDETPPLAPPARPSRVILNGPDLKPSIPSEEAEPLPPPPDRKEI